jgi:hypothetical protein
VGSQQGISGIRVIGATVISALGSTIASGAHGFPEQDAKRKALNDFIRSIRRSRVGMSASEPTRPSAGAARRGC